MNLIRVNGILPRFISGTDNPVSEIWCKEVHFKKGDYTLVSATSGAGKSSLLSFLFGERKDYQGNILFDEQEINIFRAKDWHDIRKNRISFVFQGLRLFPELTAFENIVIKNRLTNFKTSGEIRHLLECTGLGDKENEKTACLSYGQQQRIAIIRALCQPFDFLLLDEPFSHLDEANIVILSNIILQELQNRHAGMILCSLGPDYSFHYQSRFKL
jgi:ABC-type lipoprotein export system ATPase subunit